MRQLTINDTSWRFCLSFMHYACSFTKSHSMQTKLLKHMKKCQIQHADNKSRICASWLHTVTTRQLPKSQRWDMVHEHKKWCESWNLFFFPLVVWVCDFICIVSRYKVVYWEGILSVSKVIMYAVGLLYQNGNSNSNRTVWNWMSFFLFSVFSLALCK